MKILFVNSVFVTALYLGSLISSSLSFAGQTKQEFTQTTLPFWKVGALDRTLTKACRSGNFKQRRIMNLSIGYVGKIGQGATGIALKGWNLIDRKGLAKDGIAYHFYNQGYSNCRVYTSKTARRRAR